MVTILLFLHEGEEFVIGLPAVMLIGAFFIMRWANKKDPEDDNDVAEAGSEADVAVEPPKLEEVRS